MLRLDSFRVTNFRNVADSGWVDVEEELTAIIGPNESGKSNLCEALFRLRPFDNKTTFDIHYDWPIDQWENKNEKAVAIRARFMLTPDEVDEYLDAVRTKSDDPKKRPPRPKFKKQEDGSAIIEVSRNYAGKYPIDYALEGPYEKDEALKWVFAHIPRFVYVDDYGTTGTQVELDHLAKKLAEQGWSHLSPEEQTIKIILDLAKIDINDFLEKGRTVEGRTLRTFDKKNASAYLSRKFYDLWKQKKVDFDIEIDGTTLNILCRDEGLHMPVRLKARSTGFRWYVAFAWRFTHATSGDFKNTVLLLEEPGIHLHPAAQVDLLRVFSELSNTNQIIYTTHLPTLVDPGFPERIRIVELADHHAKVTKGLVTSSRTPMMVIEASLGLSPEMSGLLGNRKTIIVEGQDDATILWKLSTLLNEGGLPCIPEDVFLWPAQGASKSPMYAGFLLGHKWKGGVLLDSDNEGRTAKEKIQSLYKFQSDAFFASDLTDALGLKGQFTIEDLLGPDFYVDAVAQTYRIALDRSDLIEDQNKPMVNVIDDLLKSRGLPGLEKGRVKTFIFKQFSKWKKIGDLPPETQDRGKKLFAFLAACIAKLQ